MDPITVVMSLEKATKNTIRYAEETDEAPKIKTLYIQKWTLKKALGPSENPPQRIRVTIEAS